MPHITLGLPLLLAFALLSGVVHAQAIEIPEVTNYAALKAFAETDVGKDFMPTCTDAYVKFAFSQLAIAMAAANADAVEDDVQREAIKEARLTASGTCACWGQNVTRVMGSAAAPVLSHFASTFASTGSMDIPLQTMGRQGQFAFAGSIGACLDVTDEVRAIRKRSAAAAATQPPSPPLPAEPTHPIQTPRTVAASAPASPAPGVRTASPSFDCAKASSPTEKALCSEPLLALMDVSLADHYRVCRSSGAGVNQDALRSDQLSWMKTRNACASDALCIGAAYLARISALASACRS